MTQKDNDPSVLAGRVKWFDPVKGFGFIVSDQSANDILLHANVLRNFGQGSVADGAEITVRVQKTDRGVQAVEIVDIESPPALPLVLPEDGPTLTIEEIEALPHEPARMKWFDKSKGFGFANVFGQSDDVFVHMEVLRQSGFADLQAGEAVALKIVAGKRGRMAVRVTSWEVATRDGGGK